MGQTDIKAEVGQAIDKPVPVESRLDDDLQVGSEGGEQIEQPRQLIADLLLKKDGLVIVNNTEMRISCAQINSAVEMHGRSPL